MHYNNIKQSYLKNLNKLNAMMIIVYEVRKRSIKLFNKGPFQLIEQAQ